MTLPRFLTFDVFGTVLDWRGTLVRDMAALGARRGIEADWPLLAEEWRRAYRPTLERVNAGNLPWGNFMALVRVMFDELAPRLGLDGLSDEDRSAFVALWRTLDPWPDARAGLERLRERFVIATLSNGSLEMLVANAKHADLVWDCVLSCEMIERYKPDPAVYRLAARLFEVHPSQIMMVAAHNYDLRAAKDEGLQTAFVRRAAEWGPHQQADLNPELDVDVVARDFVDLAAQLGA